MKSYGFSSFNFNMKIIHLLYGVSFLGMSCQHTSCLDTVSTPKCDCVELPRIEGPSVGYEFYTHDSASFSRPFPNPNNADEFLFVHHSRLDILYTYNVKSKLKKKLLEGRILFVPKWGKKDWILVTREDEKIWKIKSNGDSLRLLSSTAANYVPEWNQTCDKIIFYKESNNPYSYIMNEQGSLMDSVLFKAQVGGDWNHSSGFFIQQGFVANGNIYMTDVVNKKPIVEIPVDNGDPLGVTWINNQKIFAATMNGLYLVDVPQKASQKLKCACGTKYYLFPRYWEKRNKIIAERVTLTRLQRHDVKVEQYIVMMNIDGTQEEIIDIPK